MATSERYNDRSGVRQERTEWHNIVVWRKLAEIAGQYLKKGSLVYIEGRIQSREYDGKDGIKRRAYEIVASDMKMFPTGQGQGQNQSYQQEERRGSGPSRSFDDDFVREDDVPM